jgi:NitT/TauT family transport system substrate-binding protein
MIVTTRRSHLLSLAALSLGAAAPLAACSPKAATSVTPLTVQLSIYPQGTDAYLFLAQQKGWFKDAGLNVDIVDGRGSNYSMQVLTSGHADVGVGTLTPLVFADQRGAKAVAVAEFWPLLGPAVIAGKDTGIAAPADLKGKKVAIAAAGPWPPLLSSFLAKFNLTQNDLNLMYVDINSLFSMYISKQVDAILTADTAITETGPRRPSVLLRASDYGVNLPGTGMFSTQDILAGPKAPAIARFMAVCVKAFDYLYDGHEDEAASTVMALRPTEKLTKAVLLSQMDLYKDRFQADRKIAVPGTMEAKKWADQIAYMKSINMLKGDVNVDSLYTNKFLPSA